MINELRRGEERKWGEKWIFWNEIYGGDEEETELEKDRGVSISNIDWMDQLIN